MRWAPLVILLLGLGGCEKDIPQLLPASDLNPVVLPNHFPAMEFPADNEPAAVAWQWGKALFYDVALSRDSSISCGTCHQQEYAFATNVATNSGVDDAPGTRNSPSLANVGYHSYFTREGGVPTLEMQVFVPIQEHNEFDFNMVLLAERLAQNPEYEAWSSAAYDRPVDPFGITRALATFERSLVSGGSRYDRFLQGKLELSENEQQGMELFFGDSLKCGSCHSGFNLTNYAFENNGLYASYEDIGRMRLTNDPEDEGKFKVPSLRNLSLTAPYMHDGSLADIDAVLSHYASGGSQHPNQSDHIEGFVLSTEERIQLIAFLESLTDFDFINDSRFQP